MSTNIPTKDLGIVGLVARFKPVHKGHVAMLEAVCSRAKHVYIGLGSTNKYNLKNPFTANESREMVELALKQKYANYSFVEVPDLDNGPKWREMILGIYCKLDHFVTANDYVESLLKNDYKIIYPLDIIPEEKRVWGNATIVRVAMAKGEKWEELVPDDVVDYIKQNKLDERFCKEFGLATIVDDASQIMAGSQIVVGDAK